MTTQLQLFTDQELEKKPARSYTVQKYKMSYVKEKNYGERVTVTNKADIVGFCRQDRKSVV